MHALLYSLYSFFLSLILNSIFSKGPIRTHIKFFIFRNIFLGIEKIVITFSILKKIFFKKEN